VAEIAYGPLRLLSVAPYAMSEISIGRQGCADSHDGVAPPV